MLAAVSQALLAVPGSLTLLLVEDRWAPLLRDDDGARDAPGPDQPGRPWVGGRVLGAAWVAAMAAVFNAPGWRSRPAIRSVEPSEPNEKGDPRWAGTTN